MTIDPLIEEILDNLQPYMHLNRWVVAFSGGADSSVLLSALARINKEFATPKLVALHINHGLQQQAIEWENDCSRICQSLNIDLIIAKANIDSNQIKLYGVEQAARDYRYQIFNKYLQANDCLIQGHHKNDQAETMLLRLCRGTGLDGLSGIPKTRKLNSSCLIRPMLNISRTQIINYAKQNNICYINDPSNDDTKFSRNFIRHEILPKLESKWPKIIDRLYATATEIGEVADFIMENVAQKLQYCKINYQLCGVSLYSGLSITKFNEFELEEQRRIIRLWLKENKVLSPSRDVVNKIITEVINSNIDASPKIKVANYFIRRYLDSLLLVAIDHTTIVTDVHWDWQNKPSKTINNIMLTMVASSATSNLNINLPARSIVIKFRHTIDPKLKFSIAGRNCSKKLKQLMQEYNVPPWLRDRIPLLFDGDEMIAAPGLWVCDKYQAKKQQKHQCKLVLV
jgi:tRNA(Ile)-lysidine synthase